MAAITAISIVGAGLIATGIYSTVSANNTAADAQELAEANMDQQAIIANRQLEFQKKQQATLDKQKAKYAGMKFRNPYADVKNPMADLQTDFENVYEDLTVNQQQADFQAQLGQQQRADTMRAFRGAAGGSGIAGLAQVMANQSQMQNQQISASIGMQESRNQMASAKGAAAVQSLEAAREQQIAGGEGAADMARRGGEAQLQQQEMSRQATLLGVEMGGMAGANAGVQSAYANQMAAGNAAVGALSSQAAAQYGMAGSIISGTLGLAGSIAGGAMAGGGGGAPGSDRKLKKNINKIGESPSGLNIYSFKYKDTKHGEGLFQGVMSDEVPQKAVGTRDGYDTVDYSMLDVEFKQI